MSNLPPSDPYSPSAAADKPSQSTIIDVKLVDKKSAISANVAHSEDVIFDLIDSDDLKKDPFILELIDEVETKDHELAIDQLADEETKRDQLLFEKIVEKSVTPTMTPPSKPNPTHKPVAVSATKSTTVDKTQVVASTSEKSAIAAKTSSASSVISSQTVDTKTLKTAVPPVKSTNPAINKPTTTTTPPKSHASVHQPVSNLANQVNPAKPIVTSEPVVKAKAATGNVADTSAKIDHSSPSSVQTDVLHSQLQRLQFEHKQLKQQFDTASIQIQQLSSKIDMFIQSKVPRKPLATYLAFGMAIILALTMAVAAAFSGNVQRELNQLHDQIEHLTTKINTAKAAHKSEIVASSSTVATPATADQSAAVAKNSTKMASNSSSGDATKEQKVLLTETLPKLLPIAAQQNAERDHFVNPEVDVNHSSPSVTDQITVAVLQHSQLQPEENSTTESVTSVPVANSDQSPPAEVAPISPPDESAKVSSPNEPPLSSAASSTTTATSSVTAEATKHQTETPAPAATHPTTVAAAEIPNQKSNQTPTETHASTAEATTSPPTESNLDTHPPLSVENSAASIDSQNAEIASKKKPLDSTAESATLIKGWVISLGSYKDKKMAEQKASEFNQTGAEVQVATAYVKGQTWFRVVTRGFKTQQEAQAYSTHIKKITGVRSVMLAKNS
ncbi:MAG: hypothetical protein RL637_1741 [Pseudomonadota bacterium]